MDALKPCPFCAEIPELPDGEGTQYEIECECGMARSCIQISDLMTISERHEDCFIKSECRYREVYIQRARDEAIENWNSRSAAEGEG